MADANGRQTNATDYAYYNPLPGTVASGSRAIDSHSETSNDVLNPAFKSTGTYLSSQDQLDAVNPGAAGPRGAEDLDNPAALAGAQDTEGVPLTDHSPQAPKAPTGVTATAGTAGHATVNWTAPVDTDGYAITGYQITASSVTSGATTPVVTTVGNVSTFSVAGLTSAKVYTFVVAAINAQGVGAASAATGNVTIA